MSTPPERTGSANASAATESKATRRIGLALLLGGLSLFIGGLALPWDTFTDSFRCTAPCVPGSSSFTVVPLSNLSLFPTVFLILVLLPYSLLIVLALVVAVLKVALQERLPADHRSAVPALILAGMLLAGILYSVLVFAQGFQGPFEENTLAPGGFVSVFGCLLVAVGSWLRYHPARPMLSQPLAQFTEVPTKR